MSEMLWASTSWSSRAIWSRSSLARRRCSSRPTRDLCARSRRTFTTSVAVASTSSQAASPRMSWPMGAGPLPNQCGSQRNAAHPTAIDAHAAHRRPRQAAFM